MPGRGEQTSMPRAALPRSGDKGDALIFWIAFGVASLFVGLQIGLAITFTPVVLLMYADAGQPLPPFLSFAQAIGPLGIFLFLAVLDGVIFALCAWAARHSWIGLLFVPSAIFLAITLVLAVGLGGAAAAVALG